MAETFKIVIPARYASTRLPGKPLLPIQGRPMIEWVYRSAAQSEADEIIVATDDERIAQAVKGFGGDCVMTRADHANGTDRIVEVCALKAWPDETIVVNLQGDEPLMPSVNLTQVAHNLAVSDCSMATLHKAISGETAQDPNVVKLVLDHQGRALYFSRAPIPYPRDDDIVDYFGHIGLYAYRVGFLKAYASMDACALEQAEKLEQLRALYHGFSIHSAVAAKTPGPGVDTESDLAEVADLIGES